MDRRRNINQINSKYSGSVQQPLSNITPLPTIVGGTTTIRRSRITGSTIGANQTLGRVITSNVGNTTLGVSGVVGERVRTSFVGGTQISGGITNLRTSKIITPPVYEAVTHPPVYETITTPTRVYQIVTPIIDVAPAVSTLETTKIGGQGRLWSRKERQGGSRCPWWCLLLLCLLFALLLLGGFLYLYKHCIGNNQEQIVQPILQPVLPVVTKQPEVKQPEPVVTKQPEEVKQPQEQQVPPKTPHCPQGSFLHNGRCLKCPPESTWNGTNCIKRVITKTKTVQYKSQGESSGDNEIEGQNQSSKSSSNSSSEQSKEGQNSQSKSQQKSEQKQESQKKQTTQNEGEQSKQSTEKQHKHINIKSH